MSASHEITASQRATMLECRTKIKELIYYLRKFLDEEDYSYIEKAYQTNEQLKNNQEFLKIMAGYDDLNNNIVSIYSKWRENGGNVDSMLHARISNQVVYAITRANLIATGLEFKLKRMRKG
ncbi:MAG: hypothetical protein NXY59_04455 [Aigarchaeota archaeon]|nr:hypothetical protein [Candidatus Pelearchaeum maunauluense]